MKSAAGLADTRFSAPQQRVALIPRPALTDALEDGLHRRLVLLQAPAGYGKSTLLGQWRDTLTARGIRAVWLSLDEDCDTPAEFVAGLIMAAAIAGVQVAAPDLAPLQSTDGQALRSTLTALLAKLDRDQQPVVFILDDYHLVQNSQTDALLDLFIRRMPASVHLVLASRSRPGLALPQLRAQGQIRELGAEELRFSLAEAFDLLREDLPDAEIADLAARSEGWPIALQLAAIWVRNQGGGTGLLQTFSGSADDMGDYLATQVFAQLPDHLQTFLLEASILDRFNSASADAARGALDSASLMDELRRFNIILIPLDEARTWWRHHHLMADFLASRRGRLGVARLIRMHEDASLWFEAEGLLLEAVRHARAAQNRERMVAVVENAGCIRLCLKEGFSRVRALFAYLTTAEIEASAILCLAETVMLFQGGKLRAGDHKLKQVRRMMQTSSLRRDEAFRGDLLVVEALRAGYGDGLLTVTDRAALDALCSLNLDADLWFGGFLNNIGCLLDLRSGAIESARLCGQKALEYFRAAPSPYACVFMNAHLGLIAIAQGRLSEANDHFRAAEELVLDRFNDNISLLSIVRTAMAEVAYARNDIAKAATLLAGNLTTIGLSEGWPELYAGGYATSVLVSLAQGDSGAAEATLATAVELAQSRELPRLNLFLMACRATLLIRIGRVAEAAAILAEVETGLADSHAGAWAERDEYAIAKARLHMANALPGKALGVLEALAGEARQQGRIRSQRRAETLSVLAMTAQGQDAEAAEVLLRVVERTRGEGERRLFIDEGPVMAERLRDLVRRHSPAPLAAETCEYIADLLAGFRDPTPGHAKTRLLATLTRREREILGALTRGGSNKVIARAIDLSENAVKFHLKNIFRKLGASDRGMAVTMTEKLELLS